MNKKKFQIFVLVIIVAAIFALWYVYSEKKAISNNIDNVLQMVAGSQKHPLQTKKPIIIPTKVIYPLPPGEQTYLFSYGDQAVGPKIQKATISTLVPKKGEAQTATIIIANNSPVTGASATLYTDNQQKTYELKLINGSPTNGTWEASWTMSDSYNDIYHLNFLLKSATGNWSGALTFR